MLTKCYAILFLALVSVLFIASIDAKQQYNLTIHHASTINISFKSLLNGSENSVYFVCDPRTFVVPPQRSHMITVITDYAVSCHATWKVVQATITAFDPKTDLKLDSGVYCTTTILTYNSAHLIAFFSKALSKIADKDL
jgi:hypothetical protein